MSFETFFNQVPQGPLYLGLLGYSRMRMRDVGVDALYFQKVLFEPL